MAIVNVPVVVGTRDGATVTPVTGDVANGHSIDNATQRVGIRVYNSGVAPYTITFQTPFTKDGLELAERTETVASGEIQWFGPFDNATYGQADPDNSIVKNAVLFQIEHADMILEAYRVN